MSYQVGWACFATLQDAGTAACTNFIPTTGFTGGGLYITNASCQFAGSDGSLQIKLSTALVSGGVPVTSFVNFPQTYQRCQYQDFVDAGLLIFSALLTAFFMWWGLYQIYKLLHWSRGDNQ